VHVYGQREADYPESAAVEFLSSVLPEFRGFILSELSMRTVASEGRLPHIAAFWRDGRHEIVTELRR
jgi:hypothetical protein